MAGTEPYTKQSPNFQEEFPKLSQHERVEEIELTLNHRSHDMCLRVFLDTGEPDTELIADALDELGLVTQRVSNDGESILVSHKNPQ